MIEPKFGDIGQEPSTDDGSIATFMYVGNGQGLYLADTDSLDKSLVGWLGNIGRWEDPTTVIWIDRAD